MLREDTLEEILLEEKTVKRAEAGMVLEYDGKKIEQVQDVNSSF